MVPLESVWLAGDPFTVKLQGVTSPTCVLMRKDQVQLVSAASHTRCMLSIVHWSTSAIADLTSGEGVGAARATAARREVMAVVVNFILNYWLVGLKVLRLSNSSYWYCWLSE